MYRVGKEEVEAVQRVIDSKVFFKSNDACQETKKCEETMKQMFACDHALVMTSGKASLISALIALGIGPGDEVLVPGYTYIATAMAVTAVGAIPVICEVDETLTMSAADAEKKISKYTKALMPVHIQGFPCNMDALCALAEKYDLKIVEDSCQADGGSYHGKRLGTIGDAGALSFNQYKIISCGEGGAMLTNNRQIYDRALIYHDASAVAYLYTDSDVGDVAERQFCGTEYRTNEINAAILRQQLLRLDGILADLRRVKAAIMEGVQDLFTFAPSNDLAGDCGVTLPFRFESEAEARCFAESDGIDGVLPIDTGKHIYRHWTPIMEKYGAVNPLFDPFKMEANKELNANYAPDMCPKTLDYLSRTVYVAMNPDWTDAEVADMIAKIRAAK